MVSIRQSIVAVLLGAFLGTSAAVAKPPYRHGGVTVAEALEITSVIRRHTAEPILGFSRLSTDTIHVETGRILGPDAGDGHEYDVRKTRGRWKVIYATIWMASHKATQPSNQAMQPTAGRSEAASQFMKTPPFQATLALASGG